MTLNISNYWVIVGIVLVIGEMLTGGFFLIFIALGAFAASLIAAFDQPVALQLLGCAAVSVAGVTALRKTLQRKMLKTITMSTDVGKELVVDQGIPPHKRARITYQGSTWEAVNMGSENIGSGDRAVIVGVDGISLLVRKVN